MIKDYEGMTLDAAIAKIKAKPFHDAEDVQFVRARADYFTPEEFAAITGGKRPKAAKEEAEAADEAPAAEATPEVPEGDVDPKAHKLDELQAMAAEANLDTSGTKAELADRINAARK